MSTGVKYCSVDSAACRLTQSGYTLPPRPTVSHHLAKLKQAGLVASLKQGVWRYYMLRNDLLETVEAAIALIP